MKDDILEKYREAGKIAAKAREHGKTFIKNSAAYTKVVEETEKKIMELGGKPAFPVNLSVNEVGAHDTADIKDGRVLDEGLVKLDVGVHIDGYIGDTATTISLDSGKEDMIMAVEEALDKAMKRMVPGERIKNISAEIEKTIKEFGYRPIRNLTGHGLGKYDLHAKMSFPNVKTDIDYKLKEGDVFALEPFATDGAGKVKDSSKALIYKYNKDAPVRSRDGRKILNMAKEEFKKLPFAKRWLEKQVSPLKLNIALRQLVGRNALREYHVLKEGDNGAVSQAEHTVIVGEKPEITTELD